MSLGRTLRTLRHLRPEQVAWRLWFRALRPVLRTSLYRRMVTGPATLPQAFPPAPPPGDAENGRRILSGGIRLLARDVPLGDWSPAGETPLWRFTLNYFEWLADLRAVDGADAARTLVLDWWRVHRDRMGAEPWHPYPTSLRLAAWLAHGPWLLAGADDAFRRTFATALDRHARTLAHRVERDVAGNHIIKNLKALALAGRFLPGHAHRLEPALAELKRELARQILADGCHYELSPAYHVQVMADLVDLSAALAPPLPWLDAAIARMAGALAFFRHGDGRLAQFNDGDEGHEAVLARLPAAPAPDALPDAGYHRLEAGGALVLFDTGRCCPDDLPAHAHADTLSFEFSDGAHRVVVNSGTYAYQDPAWRNRLRGTAAHSTVTVDGGDSAEVYGVFRLGRRPARVWSQRDGNRVVAGHDGWRHLGIVHRRSLALSDGLAGEDVVEGAAGRRVTARFHLHPDVAAVAEGPSVVLRLPGGGGWRFTAEGGHVALSEGVYAPHFGVLRPTVTIVLDTAGAATTRLAWTFSRL